MEERAIERSSALCRLQKLLFLSGKSNTDLRLYQAEGRTVMELISRVHEEMMISISGKLSQDFPELQTSCLLEGCESRIYLPMQNMLILLCACVILMKVIPASGCRQDGISHSDYIIFPLLISHQKIRYACCNRLYSGKWIHLQALVCRIRGV